MRRLSYLLVSLPIIISIGLQLAAPGIVGAASSDVTLGFNYDDSNGNVNSMTKDINATSLGSDSSGVGFSNSQVIAIGGIFGSGGTIMPYTNVVSNDYYNYSSDFYCTTSGVAQQNKPAGTDPVYKMTASTLLRLDHQDNPDNKNFTQIPTLTYEGGITDISYIPSSASNTVTLGQSWEQTNNGYPVTSSQVQGEGANDVSTITQCLESAGIPADWRANWLATPPTEGGRGGAASAVYAPTPTPPLQNLVYEANIEHKDVSFWNKILNKQGGGVIGSPVATSGPDAGVTSGTGSSSAPTISCSVTGLSILNPLNWLLCGAVQGMSDIIGFADSAITSQLAVGTNGASTDQPIQIFCSGYTGSTATSGSGCQAYHSAWSQFRDIALGLMAIAGLSALIAQAMGFEFLDAYTIRKVLPRILIAVVAITLSWQLMALFVQFSNDLGYGVRALIYFPFTQGGFSSVSINLNNLGANGASLLTALGALSLGFFGLLALAASGAFALLLAFFVLVLRQIAIIMLIILAPIGILGYVLPNTQNVFKLWWDSFSKALLMFPLIVALIATGHVFAAIASASASKSSDPTLYTFAAFVAYFAPYFLIPTTYKLAGGAVGRISSFVNDRGRGGFDRLSKFRANQTQKRFQNAGARAQQGRIFKTAPANSRRDKFNRLVQNSANVGSAGKNPLGAVGRMKAARNAAILENALEGFDKEKTFQPLKGDDDSAHAILHGRGTQADARAWLEASGKFDKETIDQKLANIALARAAMGDSALQQAAVLSGFTSSTSWGKDPVTGEEGIGKMLSDIDKVSGGDEATRARLIGKAKELAPASGRTDLVAPFSDMIQTSKAIGQYSGDQRSAAIEMANDTLHDKVVETEGAGYILGGKGRAVEAFIPSLRKRLNTSMKAASDIEYARRTGDTSVLGAHTKITDTDGTVRDMTFAEANRNLKQDLASTAGLLDAAGSVSPEKAKMLANGLLNGEMTGSSGKTVTVSQAINDLRTDEEFGQMRREYDNAARAAAAAAGAGGPPTPPGGPAGGGTGTPGGP